MSSKLGKCIFIFLKRLITNCLSKVIDIFFYTVQTSIIDSTPTGKNRVSF